MQEVAIKKGKRLRKRQAKSSEKRRQASRDSSNKAQIDIQADARLATVDGLQS
jgi:hypothetical protein